VVLLGGVVGTFALVSSAILIPVAVVAGNIYLRSIRAIPVTAGADIMGLLITFDGAAAIAHEDFRPLVAHQALQQDLLAILIDLGAVGALLWLNNIWSFERRVFESFDSAKGQYVDFPLGWFFIAWLSTLTLITLHILLFTLGRTSA
jgi:hypothetical protein